MAYAFCVRNENEVVDDDDKLFHTNSLYNVDGNSFPCFLTTCCGSHCQEEGRPEEGSKCMMKFFPTKKVLNQISCPFHVSCFTQALEKLEQEMLQLKARMKEVKYKIAAQKKLNKAAGIAFAAEGSAPPKALPKAKGKRQRKELESEEEEEEEDSDEYKEETTTSTAKKRKRTPKVVADYDYE
jgi:hypothetical protein